MKGYSILIVFAVLSAFVFLLIGCQFNTPENSTIVAGQKEQVNELVLEIEQHLLDEYVNEYRDTMKSVSAIVRNFNFRTEEINYSSIQPILKSNCYPCHRPSGPAPFSLMNYEIVKKKSLAITDVIRDGIMPPWKADNSYSSFVNAPQMSDSTRALLLYWLEHSCIPSDVNEGDIQLIPELFITLPAIDEYKITSNEDTYYYTRFNPRLSENLKVSFIDYAESNPSIVHHRTLFIDTSGLVLSQDESQKTYESLLSDLVPFTAWSKGMIPCELTENFYYNVPANSKFLLQTHYQGDGNIGKKDKFSLNLYRSSASNGNKIEFGVSNKLDIFYPANQITTETISYYVKDSTSILGIIPHMHYLCRKVECYALIGNKKINLLKIPIWDYYFQGQYIFNTPQMLPAGTTVYMSVVIDNTDKNPYQPNDPIKDVVYAQGSNDEMLTLVLLHTTQPVGKDLHIAKHIFR